MKPDTARLFRWLAGFILLVVLNQAGEKIKIYMGIPVPGPIIGMLVLFTLLNISQRLRETAQQPGELLIKHLSLLFLPAVIGTIFLFQSFHASPVSLAVMMIASTWIAIFFTASLMQWLLSPGKEESGE